MRKGYFAPFFAPRKSPEFLAFVLVVDVDPQQSTSWWATTAGDELPFDFAADTDVANLDRLVLPATLEVTYADGSKQQVRVPVETWQQHRSYVVRVAGSQPVKSATIDPAHALPDSNRANNTATP